MNSKKWMKTIGVTLDVHNSNSKNHHYSATKTQSDVSRSANLTRPASSVSKINSMGKGYKSSLQNKLVFKPPRCESSAQLTVYRPDSEVRPNYFCRPGPGKYQVDQGIGKKTNVAGFQNSPSWVLSKPQSVPAGFVTIEHFRNECSETNLRNNSRSPSATAKSIGRVSMTDLAKHRFFDFVIDMHSKQKQLRILNPDRTQV